MLVYFLSDKGEEGSVLFRTNTSCLLWEVPLRETLALLRQHPQLYELVSRQTMPSHAFGESSDACIPVSY